MIRHLGGAATDRSAVAVVDLQTEPYYQLEQYFDRPNRLGRFGRCAQPSGVVHSACIDRRIVHPWLMDLYRTARSASPYFLYTEADTGRLLTTSESRQRYWVSMYPADVYDIHVYAASPSHEASRWRTGRRLPKPWFAGEAGCASGDTACTYSGVQAEPVDAWWLTHLRADGARAILVEDHETLWSYPNGSASQKLTATGRLVACLGSRRQSCTSYASHGLGERP